jgi:Ca2+/Na+ antiporter
MTMSSDYIYSERVSSNLTETLFVALAILFFLLFAWYARAAIFGVWIILFFFLFAFFLFYALNYRTLIIRLSEDALQLNFGIFTWIIPLHNIETCSPDATSLWRIGGAGIHFTSLEGRYRAMFNFLEHPRVVIALKVKKGLVHDIAFSTKQPDEVMRLIKRMGYAEDAA